MPPIPLLTPGHSCRASANAPRGDVLRRHVSPATPPQRSSCGGRCGISDAHALDVSRGVNPRRHARRRREYKYRRCCEVNTHCALYVSAQFIPEGEPTVVTCYYRQTCTLYLVLVVNTVLGKFRRSIPESDEDMHGGGR